MKTILIGHRGAMELEPENTLRSFREALRYPYVKMIEFDVQRSATGEIVVIHDEKLDRTTNGKGEVKKKTFSYIRSLNAGKGEKIPTLEEVLDLTGKKISVNIELKARNTAEEVAETIERYVKKGWRIENFLVSSFDKAELIKFKELMNEVSLGLIFSSSPMKNIKLASKIGMSSIHPDAKLVNKKFTEEARKRGLKIFSWTLKKPKEIKKMAELGVDGIFVNNPEFAFKVLENYKN